MEWVKKEDNYLRKNHIKMTHVQLAEKLNRSESSVQNRLHKLRLYLPDDIREERRKIGTFKKGIVPWNTGHKGVHYSPATEFKKGNLPPNTKYDGCITIRNSHKDRNDKPYKYIRLAKAKWQPYHQYVWEQHNGKIPKGKILWFINGDSLDVRIENLELITRQEQADRNRNPEAMRKSMEEYWHNGASDIHVASLIERDKELKIELLKQPELLRIKRLQLQLKREIRNAIREKTGQHA